MINNKQPKSFVGRSSYSFEHHDATWYVASGRLWQVIEHDEATWYVASGKLWQVIIRILIIPNI